MPLRAQRTKHRAMGNQNVPTMTCSDVTSTARQRRTQCYSPGAGLVAKTKPQRARDAAMPWASPAATQQPQSTARQRRSHKAQRARDAATKHSAPEAQPQNTARQRRSRKAQRARDAAIRTINCQGCSCTTMGTARQRRAITLLNSAYAVATNADPQSKAQRTTARQRRSHATAATKHSAPEAACRGRSYNQCQCKA